MASFRKALEKRAFDPNDNANVIPRNSYSGMSIAGVAVNADSAMKLSTVYACVRLISGTIASLPLGAYVRRGRNRIAYASIYNETPQWINNPNPESTRLEFIEQVLSSMLIHGNAYIMLIRDSYGDVIETWVLHPDDVTISRPNVGASLTYKVRGANGETKEFSKQNILHIPMLKLPGNLYGISPITNCRLTLGNSLASDTYASSYFGNSANAGGVITTPVGMTQEQIEEMANRWKIDHQGPHQAGGVGVLTGGADFKPLQINAKDAQLLESRQFNVEDVARIFGVPLSLIGVSSPGAMSYASVEANNLAFVQHTLRAILERLEQAFSQLLPMKDGFVKFNLDALLRGTTSERFDNYGKAMLQGWLSLNDIRALEDQPSIGAAGDTYRVPLQNIDVADAKNVGLDLQVKVASQLIDVGFEPEESLKAAGLDPIAHTGVMPIKVQATPTLPPNA